MDLMKSVSYIFEDDEWPVKLFIMALVGLGFASLSWILVGLVFLAAQLGWQIELIRNMRAEREHPMPAWKDFGGLISLGAGPLGALVVYNIVPLIFACFLIGSIVSTAASVGSEEAVGLVALSSMCIYVPLLVVYLAVTWLFYSIGTANYARTENIGEYFKFGALWRSAVNNQNTTLTYVLYVIIMQAVMSAISGTGIGAVVPLAFGTAINGHLLGQYALELDNKKKRS